MSEIIGGYQDALRQSLRRLGEVSERSLVLEAAISEHSPFAGATVATAPWPRGTVALSIDRESHLIPPRPETPLHPGDVVAAIVPRDVESDLRRMFERPPGR
jgi:Trk K+ transport system NAD-binding subunit